MSRLDLAVATIRNNLSFSLELLEVRSVHASESPLARNDNLLATRELVLGTAKSLKNVLLDVVFRADREKNLTNVHTSSKTLWLTEGTTHTGLETICSGT